VSHSSVNALEDNLNTMKKNIGSLIYATKEDGLNINTKKTEYMLTSCHQNARQNHNIKIAYRSFKNVARDKIFGNYSKKSKLDL
jgi:hypothetical protein